MSREPDGVQNEPPVSNAIEITHLSPDIDTTDKRLEHLSLWLSASQYSKAFPVLREALEENDGDLRKMLSSDPTHHALIAMSNGKYARGDAALFMGSVTFKDTLTGSGTRREITSLLIPARYWRGPTEVELLRSVGEFPSAYGRVEYDFRCAPKWLDERAALRILHGDPAQVSATMYDTDSAESSAASSRAGSATKEGETRESSLAPAEEPMAHVPVESDTQEPIRGGQTDADEKPNDGSAKTARSARSLSFTRLSRALRSQFHKMRA